MAPSAGGKTTASRAVNDKNGGSNSSVMAAMMLQPAVVGRFCWFQDLQFLFILNFG